jgi:hypothetical protein
MTDNSRKRFVLLETVPVVSIKDDTVTLFELPVLLSFDQKRHFPERVTRMVYTVGQQGATGCKDAYRSRINIVEWKL